VLFRSLQRALTWILHRRLYVICSPVALVAMAVEEEPMAQSVPADAMVSDGGPRQSLVAEAGNAAEISSDGHSEILEDIASLSTCDPDAARDLLEDPEQPLPSKLVKILFLDMDGPMATYVRGGQHKFELSDRITDEPYVEHLNALVRIIHQCGGPDVVKVVLSSNWRTMTERVEWLQDQFSQCGIDMVGHTDVVHVHPTMNDNVRRDIELYRAVQHGTLGRGGPYLDESVGGNQFAKWQVPAEWDVQGWIAIDDLPLDSVPANWDYVSLYAAFIPVPGDEVEASGWMKPPKAFPESMRSWFKEFRTQHFVQVSMYDGLAGTPGAVDKAINLLNAVDTEPNNVLA